MLSLIYAVTHFLSTIKKLGKDKEFKGLMGFACLLLVVGMFFYNQVEGWSLLDSLYFSTTTLTTVGLGDLHPVTPLGKIFTIIYIFLGIGIILAFVNALANHTSKENPITRMLNNYEEKKH